MREEIDFYSWKYQKVLSDLGDSPISFNDNDFETKTFLQIGSLIFLGEWKKADVLLERALTKKVSPTFKIKSLFYKGIGLVRRSLYKEADELFLSNLNIKSKDTTSLFYANQGWAFSLFFKGKFEDCLVYAEKAYSFAVTNGFLYGQALSLDLMGHGHCQLGKIRQGIHEIEKGILCAKKIGNGGLTTALKVSLLRYRAQFGVDILGAEEELKLAIKDLKPEDTYSKAELYLELSRQLVLRGRASEAQHVLDEASELIYKHQNKRQNALLNFRYATLMLIRGEAMMARSLLHSSNQVLDKEIDSLLIGQYQGLLEELTPSLKSKGTGLYIDSRIRLRKQSIQSSFPRGEDLLGDLIDNVSRDGSARIPEITHLGLLGLIPSLLKITSKKTIYLSARYVFIVNQGDVIQLKHGFTQPMRKILQLLSEKKFKSKQELIERTWGYEYLPETHDKVLYATISKIRTLFQNCANWIEWSQDGYRLADDVSYLLEKLLVDQTGPKEVESQIPASTRFSELNLRQIQILRLLDKGKNTDVSRYSKKFRVCKMTACRDLTTLFEMGLVARVGKARATKYIGKDLL